MDHPCTWIFLRCSEVSCFKIYVPHNCQRVLSGKHIYSHDFFVESTVDGRNPALVGRSCGAGLLHQQYHTLLQVNPRLWQRNSTQLEINQFSSQKSFGWGGLNFPKHLHESIVMTLHGAHVDGGFSCEFFRLYSKGINTWTPSHPASAWVGNRPNSFALRKGLVWWLVSAKWAQKTVINWATTCYNSYK